MFKRVSKTTLATGKVLSETKGATAVEFALILPVLVILVLGIIQFGVILSVQSAMQAAAKSGVRTYAIFKENGGAGADGQARKAVKDSLSVWWELFFEGNDPITTGCKCVDDATDTEVWSTEITISLATVSVVDYLGLFTGQDEMNARATWPVKDASGTCPEADGGCPPNS